MSTSFLLSSFWSQRKSLWLTPCSFFCGQLLPHLIYLLPLLFPVFLLFWSQPLHICHFSCLWPTITIPACSLMKTCSSAFLLFLCPFSSASLLLQTSTFQLGDLRDSRNKVTLAPQHLSCILTFSLKEKLPITVSPASVRTKVCLQYLSGHYLWEVWGRDAEQLSITICTDLSSWRILLEFKP